MTPLEFILITFGISLVAGVLGSLLGLGGGIIVVPALTLWLGVDIRFAIGASIVSVIATSSGAAAAYVRERMTNLRVAMFLELATTSGAITGAYVAGHVATRWLYVVFGLVLCYSAIEMFRHRHDVEGGAVPADPLADRLQLHGSYFDQNARKEIAYRVTHTRLGLVLMYIAGVVSGLLGIGSGALKVPAMDLAMRMPIKVSTATSNFMIGVTAAASAGLYFARGDVDPYIAAPVAAGVLIGATGGSLLLGRLKSNVVRIVFVAVLVWISVQMVIKGARMSQQPADAKRVRQVELFISGLLRTGVIVSLILVCAGLAISIARHRQEMSDPAQRHQLIESTSGSPHTFMEVMRGLRSGQGRAIITLGLLLLIATPVMRVAASIVGFIYERDRIFVVVTSVVLALLLLSFVLGRAGG